MQSAAVRHGGSDGVDGGSDGVDSGGDDAGWMWLIGKFAAATAGCCWSRSPQDFKPLGARCAQPHI